MLPLNPITFSDLILDAIRKDMPSSVNDTLVYKIGKQVIQNDTQGIDELRCMPGGDPKILEYSDNHYLDEVPYVLYIKTREAASLSWDALRRAYLVMWSIRLMQLDDASELRKLIVQHCGQFCKPSGIEPRMIDGEFTGEFLNRFCVIHRTEFLGEYPPVSEIIKSLYRLETEEYIEGEVIDE